MAVKSTFLQIIFVPTLFFGVVWDTIAISEWCSALPLLQNATAATEKARCRNGIPILSMVGDL